MLPALRSPSTEHGTSNGRCGRRSQLAHVAKEAKATLEVDHFDIVADRGYFSSEEILACEEASITVTLPRPMTSNSKAEARFGKQDIWNCVGTRDNRSFAVHGLARALPLPTLRQRPLRASAHGFGADARYSFIVRDFHPLLLAGLPAHSEDLHRTRHWQNRAEKQKDRLPAVSPKSE